LALVREERYLQACAWAEAGEYEAAVGALRELQADTRVGAEQALLDNDLAVVTAVRGDVEGARELFERALRRQSDCQPARANRRLLEEETGGAVGRPATASGTEGEEAARSGDRTQRADGALRPHPSTLPTPKWRY